MAQAFDSRAARAVQAISELVHGELVHGEAVHGELVHGELSLAAVAAVARA